MSCPVLNEEGSEGGTVQWPSGGLANSLFLVTLVAISFINRIDDWGT